MSVIVSFATKFRSLFSILCPFAALVVLNSIPVNTKDNKAANQIPNNVKDVTLLNCLTLLDKIRNPNTNKIKKGIPTTKNVQMVNNQYGIIES